MQNTIYLSNVTGSLNFEHYARSANFEILRGEKKQKTNQKTFRSSYIKYFETVAKTCEKVLRLNMMNSTIAYKSSYKGESKKVEKPCGLFRVDKSSYLY